MSIVYRFINWLRRRKYKCVKVNNVQFYYDPNYDNGLKEYYLYISKIIINALSGLENSCIIALGIERANLWPKNVSIIHIDFQVEHTLVKEGGRGGKDSPIGEIGIQDNSGKNYLVRIANYEYLIGKDIIIDYSRINLANISRSGHFKNYQNKTFLIAPALYELKTYSVADKREYDTITLFRNTEEPRRKDFIRTLNRRNVRFENVNNIFEDLDSVYLNTKILINIRQTDFHDTLEELRILPALRCGVIVISEDAPLKECCMYSDFILWGKLEDLPGIILDVQANYESYHAKIFSNPKFYTRMNRLSKVNQLNAIKIKEKIQSLL